MTQRVAIIDDSEINVVLFRHLVGQVGGCEVETFTDPLAGLAWCIRESPDLIVVDYMMPELDGISFIERLRATAADADLPVLMITASNEKKVLHRALEVGATDFLTKPVDNVEFRARIRNMLALHLHGKRLASHAEWLAEEVARATRVIREREQELVFRMSRAAEFRDPETGAHIQRMAHYSRMIGQRLGMAAGEVEALLAAAPMHDVGKIAIPDQILLKPGRLTADELTVMQRHSDLGFELLRGSDAPVIRLGAEIALTHHEKFDGSGYPRGLAGADIPLPGRIVAVADVFDALTSVRPYKKAWSTDEARHYVEDNRGRHFDPVCVDAFLAAWDEVPAIRTRFADEVDPAA